jgi:2-dehydro-3-deoxygalactonokinase
MAILAVDSGTTSTRVWLVEDGNVRDGATARSGARDVVAGGQPPDLLTRVRRLADGVLAQNGRGWDAVDALVAFGMITSELGLEEVAHLQAPIDRDAIAGAIVRRSYPDVLPAPVYLVPGVRCEGAALTDTDFMRGEETEVVGLLSARRIDPPFLYVSTGSHSKFVYIDARASIGWSVTTLSGELVWALHRETILSELVDPDGDVRDLAALDEGARLATRVGLSRALFAARLMNRVRGASPETCSDFVHGAVAAQDLISLRATLGARGVRSVRVAIAGNTPFAAVYRHLIEREAWAASIEEIREPLGAIGAWSLFVEARRRQEASR